MKVIHITSMHEFDDDRIFQRACLGLSKEDIEVGLIAQHNNNSKFNYKGITIYPLKVRSGISRRIFSSYQAMRLALKNKADIYHFHDPDLLPFMLFLSLFKRKVVYDIHELYRVRFSQWKFIPKFLQNSIANLYQWLEHLFIRGLSGYTLPSESMYSLWYKKLNMPFSIVRNIHLLSNLRKMELKHSAKDKEFIIYTSGVNGPDRRNINILKAFARLHGKYQDMKLIFGGVYRPKGFDKKLKDLAKELNVNDRFELQGFLPYNEQFRRSSNASVGLVLLEHNEKNYIATSNRMFEYMYCGLPIICESLPEPISVLNKANCGYHVDSQNIQEISKKIEYLYLNPSVAESMGANGHQAVIDEYYYEKDLKQMISFYQKIINR